MRIMSMTRPVAEYVRPPANGSVSNLPRPVLPMHYAAINCPCCKRPVGVPDLKVLVDHYDIPRQQAAILEAVWKGKGQPVPNERIFGMMYADDPDGGPSPSRMYAALKVALCHLRGRLRGSGISIETCGYRRGYRLVIEPQAEQRASPDV